MDLDSPIHATGFVSFGNRSHGKGRPRALIDDSVASEIFKLMAESNGTKSVSIGNMFCELYPSEHNISSVFLLTQSAFKVSPQRL